MMDDESILKLLLNQSKTTAFLKRAKLTHPDKWRRVYGNVARAYEMLKDHLVQRSVFSIGVFDPNKHDDWPWHYHYDDGVYLSANNRLCKLKKAAEFDDIEKARQFFHAWGGSNKYKMEIIESKKEVKVSYEASFNADRGYQPKKPTFATVISNASESENE